MLQARDIMTKTVITVTPQTSVLDLARLLAQHKINGTPVVDDDGRLVGVITQTDLIDRAKKFQLPHVVTILDAHFYLERPSTFRKNLEKMLGNQVADVMTAPAITITPELSVDEVATIMAHRNAHTLPVLQDGNLVGVIGKIDIIRALSQEG
ncbi:CBS domain-containing protein [Desulfobacca acetoxidans]|uniref:CBS domain containing membrane protein n=1 Tax=Desulfobacca acetoxidans (strain ATCC 700848 / DSM 11109 / ASRB2) TaxID=880072 RepID=F2NF53_DESAR|nr:CBS domain-containing protein [Desulfobacca acetoxidans]AEB08608.1 CBS domain containing membrane protein [Desulfobacca acetoxidans DSM 11109]HAY20576.1 CBS domain-containing protein [Desulfobacterales bacterium]